MALTVDTTSNGFDDGTPTTLTVSHTCAVGATLLVVSVCVDSGSSTIVSGVTYNGVAMTRRAITDVAYSQTMWTLDAPASGVHDIVATVTSGHKIGLGAISFLGAYTLGSNGTGTHSGTAPSIVCTTSEQTGFVVAGITIVDLAGFANSGTGTSIYATTGTGFGGGASYQAYAAGANPTASWSNTAPAAESDMSYVEVVESSTSFRPIVTMF